MERHSAPPPIARRGAPSVEVTRRAGLTARPLLKRSNTTASAGMRWPCGITNRELSVTVDTGVSRGAIQLQPQGFDQRREGRWKLPRSEEHTSELQSRPHLV